MYYEITKIKLLLLLIILSLFSVSGIVYAQSVGGKLRAVVVGQDNHPIGAASISLFRNPSNVLLKRNIIQRKW